jgi:hypothetical protein
MEEAPGMNNADEAVELIQSRIVGICDISHREMGVQTASILEEIVS